jgi:hypothetical protein
MPDETASVVEVGHEVDAEPIGPVAERKDFYHANLGVRLVLKKSANDLVQRDMDKFMKRFTEQTQGNSVVEDNGKTVRAAMRADWVESLAVPDQENPGSAKPILSGNDVDGMKPAHVRWVAGIIDQIYNTAREVPNA